VAVRRLVLLLVALLAASGCARNPATGRLELLVLDEDDEIALGRALDADVVETMGACREPALSSHVSEVGARLAGVSERPGLPWTFRVVDEAAVNAFALPGGHVYVTRGLLAHLASESELAAVVAHEIGHVTARHGIDQLRRARAAQRRLRVFEIVDPGARHVGRVAAGTAGVLLLRHSRAHEHEADDLALRYLVRAGYDPNGLVAVLDVLDEIGAEAGETVPSWLSTHPEPEIRHARASRAIEAVARAGTPARQDEAYLRRLEGLVFGSDPRRGFFMGRTFVHPDLEFGIDVPEGWHAAHERRALVAVAADERVMMFVGLTGRRSAAAGMEAFLEDPGVVPGEAWRGNIDGLRTRSRGFVLSGYSDPVVGLVAFVELEDRVFVMLALAPSSVWSSHVAPAAESLASFRRVRDSELLGLEPMRIRLVRVEEPTTLEAFARAHPSAVPIETLALINRVAVDAALEPGLLMKRVVGFNPERARLSDGAK
jgi:predicted Zn-dependent protease